MNSPQQMEAELIFPDIDAALPAISELYAHGFAIEMLTWTDNHKGLTESDKVWIVASGIVEIPDTELFHWMHGLADRFDGDVVQAGAGPSPIKSCAPEETRTITEIARVRSTGGFC